ncbi:MAG TPA: histidine kinase [Allosphingosinicella sp.]|nr:histidine kinase [Allosphingosinicella sp.]
MNSIFSPSNAPAAHERPAGAAEPPRAAPAQPGARFFRRLAIGVILGFWLTYFITLTAARLAISASESWPLIAARGLMSLLAMLLSFAILAALRRARGRGPARRVLIAAGLALAGCMVHAALNPVVFMQFVPVSSPWSVLIAEYPISLLSFLWQYVAVSVMLLALTYGEDLTEREERIVSLQAQANAAQLSALRYQLNPHFLFNTLNSVASLIAKRPGEAEAMVVSLSDFLRSTLQMDTGKEITLGEEVQLQSLYLEIEKARFPNRLEVAIDVPPETANALVPNLISQPLIENAIKYGVARSQAPVRLDVIARAEGGVLVLEIRNDGGDAETPLPGGTSTGLRNVANRLRLHFGDEASLAAAPLVGGGYSATICLPLRTSA